MEYSYRRWVTNFLVSISLVALGLTAKEAQATAAKPPAMVVSYDPGGGVGQRQEEIRKLRRSGQRVELRGTCHSACTMYLGLKNVCVAPNARFGFHGPSGGLARLPRDAFDHWSSLISGHFRAPLRNWFMTEARFSADRLLILRGADLIRMGYSAC